MKANKIGRLSSSDNSLEENAYTCLGEIPYEPWGEVKVLERVFRRIKNPKEYCLVRYDSGVLVEKRDYSDKQMKCELRKMLERMDVGLGPIIRILTQDFPMKPLYLPELRIVGSENEILPELTEKQATELNRLSEAFFDGQERVLHIPTLDLRADKQSAIKRLVQFMATINRFFDFDYNFHFLIYLRRMEATKNRLHIELDHEETSCYDGGAGGTWEHVLYADLERLNWDWNWLRAKYGLYEETWERAKDAISYRGTIPGEECECLIEWPNMDHFSPRSKSLYLHNPFGLQGIYRLTVYWVSY